MRTRRGAHGFTLLELMVVAAIIGILSSIAIPSFQRMQLRSKAAEGRTNLAAIRTAEQSYFAEYNSYVAAAPTPAAVPGINKVPFVLGPGFRALGWLPEGDVHFQYAVSVGAPPLNFTAEAASDLDGEGTLSLFGYVAPDRAGVGVAGAIGCAATGVWDPITSTPTLMETVGPCDAVSGLSVF